LWADRETVRLRRRILQQSLYLAACPHFESIPPWGALAGVRPTKITTKHLLEGGTAKSAQQLLRDVYFVTPERRTLAVDCSEATVRAHGLMDRDDVSLYVGIPFCPTRCAYCSFVSRSVGKRTELLEPYLQALQKELALTGRLLAQSGKRVRSV
jgi:oxygen-independent coproporphyrinogen-3 oxidase